MIKVNTTIDMIIWAMFLAIPVLYVCIYLLNVSFKRKRKQKIRRLKINTVLILILVVLLKLALFSTVESNTKEVDDVTTTTTTKETTTKKTTTTTTKKTTTTTKVDNSTYKRISYDLSDAEVVGKTSKGYTIYELDGITYIDGYMIVNKTYSVPSDYNPGDLKQTVKNAADKMFAAAKKEIGYTMWAQSGFRSYETQKKLYNNYVNESGKKAADTFSARPGYSEHQTGLAFDVCATNKPCITSGFDSTPEAKWLSENAWKYGFILRYVKDKTDETGYKYESWHFRYVGGDLAKELYNNGDWITLEDYYGFTSKYSS